MKVSDRRCDFNCFECRYEDCICPANITPTEHESAMLSAAGLDNRYNSFTLKNAFDADKAKMLHIARLDKNLTIKQLSEMSSVSVSMISKWEWTGKYDPNKFNGILW